MPEEIVQGEGLFPFERVHLERLLLAADAILELSGEDPVSDVLEVELRDFRERVQLALLRLGFLPERPQVGSKVGRSDEGMATDRPGREGGGCVQGHPHRRLGGDRCPPLHDKRAARRPAPLPLAPPGPWPWPPRLAYLLGRPRRARAGVPAVPAAEGVRDVPQDLAGP